MSTPKKAESTAALTPHENGAGEFLTTGKYEWHEITPLGISFRPGTPEEYWLEQTRKGIAMFEGSRDLHLRTLFIVGDCLNFGEGAFNERYAQAIDSTRKAIRLSMKTFENVAWIAGSIAAERRHEMLSFSHHEAVAKLAAEDQTLFLTMAEEEELSVEALRKKIKEKYPSKRKGDGKAAVMKAVIDFGDEKSVLHALEKISEYLASEKCGIGDMEDARQKEFSGRILAVAEGFGATKNNKFFERMTLLAGLYLENIEESEPIREWSATRKERWTRGLNAIAKAGRRAGVIGSAKPHVRQKGEQGTGADSAE